MALSGGVSAEGAAVMGGLDGSGIAGEHLRPLPKRGQGLRRVTDDEAGQMLSKCNPLQW